MTIFFTYSFLIVLMVILSLSTVGQIIVKIGNYTGCSNTEVLIPVEIENFEVEGMPGAEKTLLFDMTDVKTGTYLFQLLSQK